MSEQDQVSELDTFVPPTRVPLMSAARARNIARSYKAFGDYLRDQGLAAEADREGRDARWWLLYSNSLASSHPQKSTGNLIEE